MENKGIQLNVKILSRILKKLNDIKVIRTRNKKIFTVNEILSVNMKKCRYVGGEQNTEWKTHLHVKFMSPDENGPIYVSVLLDKYQDLL